ncbi:MAG: AAA family ATPase [Pseudomonas sp. CO183]|nr:MAG: AAA family ATPase [Pseudomonas sp. CO183]
MHVVIDHPTRDREFAVVQQLAPQPRSIADTGLDEALLGDLVCKHLHESGVLDIGRLADRLALPGAVVDEVLGQLRKDGSVEVLGQNGGSSGLRYGLTERGRMAARDAFARSGYLGAAPIPVSLYCALLKLQTIHHGRVTERAMRAAYSGVVMTDDLLERLGVAMNSGRAMMIYGPSGTGKTYISSRLIRLLNEAIWVPHAVVIGDAVLQIYDPQIHCRLETEQPASLLLDQGIDRRLLCCSRPLLTTGGELTMDQLEIRHDPISRQYHAPLQLKASNGLFIVDDLGRQRMPPAELLNRWIVPMEERRDFLNLGGGRHCVLPFDLILVFSTNINPLDLADDAFLRRIGYKLPFGYLKRDQYERIWRQELDKRGQAFDAALLDHVLSELHGAEGVPLLPCQPRDLIDMALDRQRYLDRSGPLTADDLDWAWRNYFVQLEFLE